MSSSQCTCYFLTKSDDPYSGLQADSRNLTRSEQKLPRASASAMNSPVQFWRFADKYRDERKYVSFLRFSTRRLFLGFLRSLPSPLP
ncbi:unnamed protein product [Cuscuta campestris]|uniref:Uncharacterized protein n=1 Tax=Cuscuta campestris TaxID=132261 RepID=A0A484KTX0_9ASTE|nr:unnamed protein product [Cuscuta campestris]